VTAVVNLADFLAPAARLGFGFGLSG